VNAQNWDINTVKKINGWDGGLVTNYSKVMSKTAPYISMGGPVLMALYGGLSHNDEMLKDAIYIGTSVAGTIIVTYGMKYAFGRTRPYKKYPDMIDARDHEPSPSFPSGHSSMAFALATSLTVKYPKWYIIAPSFLWATSVGFARINEGVHYPSDVLAGAALGVGSALINVYINRWLNDKILFPKKENRDLAIYRY